MGLRPYTPNGPTPSFIEFADLNSVNRTQKSMNQNHLVHRVLIHRVLSQNSVNNNSVNEDQTLGRFVAPNLLAPNSMNIKLCEPNKLCKTNHITVKQAKTLWNNFCGFKNHKMPKFRAASSNSVKQTLQNNMQLCEMILYEANCNTVKLLLCSLWNNI